MLALPSRSAAIAHGLTERTPADIRKAAERRAQLAGFGADADGAVSSPPLSAPDPAMTTSLARATSVLDPQSNETARATATLGALAASSYWQSTGLRLAVVAYLALVVVAIGLALSILRSLNRFRTAAYEIVLGRVGDHALVARNGVRELSGVALLLDRLVFDLRYMSEQMRLTAAENAHSLRTPLATMRTALSAIKRSLPADEPRAQRALKIIDLSLDRLSSVVNSAQRNDTTMANLVAAPRSPVDFSTLAHEVIGEQEERASLRNIRIRAKLVDSVIVHAVQGALRLALLDIVASAVNASPRYGEVTIELQRDEDAGRLVVNDRGRDADTPELFFQHDFQPAGDPAAPPGFDTSRLSLWNAKRIVEAFGGEVGAQRNPHGGISVSIVLPCEHQ